MYLKGSAFFDSVHLMLELFHKLCSSCGKVQITVELKHSFLNIFKVYIQTIWVYFAIVCLMVATSRQSIPHPFLFRYNILCPHSLVSLCWSSSLYSLITLSSDMVVSCETLSYNWQTISFCLWCHDQLSDYISLYKVTNGWSVCIAVYSRPMVRGIIVKVIITQDIR